MRVIICGAGQVGYNIAAYLAREDNDITVIDQAPQAISKVNDSLDVKTILGHASNPDVLNAAGAREADMVIAVTHADEVNMIACQVAHSLFNVPRKIARIRDRAYLDPAWSNLFGRAHMPIDVIISPEFEVAKAISQRIAMPGTTNVIKLAKGKLVLCGVICDSNCPIVETPLHQLSSLFSDARLRVVTIFRDNQTIIPGKNHILTAGDEVYFIVDAQQIDRTLAGFGLDNHPARRAIILGGGNIGMSLIRELQAERPDLNLKIIEQDRLRAIQLSSEIEDVIVLHGSGLDREILEEAGIAEAEALISVTNDDETNILGSLLARQYGCKRAITLVNKNTYSKLFQTLGLGAVVSPKAITVSTIMQHVRRGRIKAVHNIGDGQVEVIEAEATNMCSIVNTPLRQLNIPNDVMVGAIIHNGDLIMPTGDTIIRPGDRVIFVATQEQARKVEKMFSAQVSFV